MNDLEVINKALTSLDVAAVGSVYEDTEPARVMSALLPVCRRTVLEEFRWAYLTDIVELVPGSGTPPETYEHIWNFPSNAITVFAVYNKFKRPVDYRTLYHLGVHSIVTQVDEALAEIIVSVLNQELWTHDIQDALSVRLAHEACPRLTGNFPLASQLLEKYSLLIKNAAQHSVVKENSRVRTENYRRYLEVRK